MFATVKCRLKNAHRYLRSDERGAVRYELNTLLGLLAGALIQSINRPSPLSAAQRCSHPTGHLP